MIAVCYTQFFLIRILKYLRYIGRHKNNFEILMVLFLVIIIKFKLKYLQIFLLINVLEQILNLKILKILPFLFNIKKVGRQKLVI